MKAAGKRHAERASAERGLFHPVSNLSLLFSFVIRTENRATKTAGVNTATLRITIVKQTFVLCEIIYIEFVKRIVTFSRFN